MPALFELEALRTPSRLSRQLRAALEFKLQNDLEFWMRKLELSIAFLVIRRLQFGVVTWPASVDLAVV